MNALQRRGVRLVCFYKSASESLEQMFTHRPNEKVAAVPHKGSLSGDTSIGLPYIIEAEAWPEPIVTIAFFRYPLARLASMWNHIVQNYSYNTFTSTGFSPKMPFREFLEEVLLRKNAVKDPHYEHQHISLSECRGMSGEIWIGRVEDLPHSWNDAVNIWGLDCTAEVVHFHSTKYPDGMRWLELWLGVEDLMPDLLNMYATDIQIWKTRTI